jgi:predicted alpha/beta superfamily hydrolase
VKEERGAMPYRAPQLAEHVIDSTFVSDRFTVKVLQPKMRTDNSERFPVVYVTDGDEFFGGLSALANELQAFRETRPFILVAIGYANTQAADLLRMRDLVTHPIRRRFREVIDQLAHSQVHPEFHDLRMITNTTDAADFLRFIREELMPFINSHYPVVRGDNNYYGYSAGGTFGLYTLFTQPETFRRYILGSPATSYDGDHFGIELVDRFRTSEGKLKAQLFLSVGELEEFLAKFDLTTGYYRLANHLRAAAISGLDLTTRLFLDETHATAWTLAFSHGLRTLLPPIDAAYPTVAPSAEPQSMDAHKLEPVKG